MVLKLFLRHSTYFLRHSTTFTHIPLAKAKLDIKRVEKKKALMGKDFTSHGKRQGYIILPEQE